MLDLYRVHNVARIRTGKYAGLVGTVTDTRSVDGKQTQARVKVEGVREGETVAFENWFKKSALERNHG